MPASLNAVGLPAPDSPPRTARKLSVQVSRLPKRSNSVASTRTTSTIEEAGESADEGPAKLLSQRPSISTGLKRTSSLQTRPSPAALARPPVQLKKRASALSLRDGPPSSAKRLPRSSTESAISILSDRTPRPTRSASSTLLALPKAAMAPPPRPVTRTPKQSTRPGELRASPVKPLESRRVSALASERRDSASSWATDSTPSPPGQVETPPSARVSSVRLALASPAASSSPLQPKTPATVRRFARPKPSLDLKDLLSPRPTSRRSSSPGLLDARQTKAMKRDLASPLPSARTSRVHEDTKRDEEEAALRIELDSAKARMALLDRQAAEGRRREAESRAKRLLDVADGYANERHATKGEIEVLRWLARDLEAWRGMLSASGEQ